jgi:copper chaperone CopZ
MTCGACSVAVRLALKKLAGVKEATVSVGDKRAVIEYDAKQVTPQQMIDAISKAGYQASLPAEPKGR